MKLADRPTPETDKVAKGWPVGAEPTLAHFCILKSRSLEQQRDHAVEALKKIADYQCIQPMDETAREALAEIEEGK